MSDLKADILIETITIKAKHLKNMMMYNPSPGQPVEIIGRPPDGCYYVVKSMNGIAEDMIIEVWKR